MTPKSEIIIIITYHTYIALLSYTVRSKVLNKTQNLRYLQQLYKIKSNETRTDTYKEKIKQNGKNGLHKMVKQDFKYLSIKKLYELIKEGIYN